MSKMHLIYLTYKTTIVWQYDMLLNVSYFPSCLQADWELWMLVAAAAAASIQSVLYITIPRKEQNSKYSFYRM